MKALAAWILDDLKRRNVQPDLVHAHKLTVEGVIGQIISKTLGIPLLVDIRGDSDSKIFQNKRSMQGLYKSIAADASAIFARAPWTIDLFEKIAGLDRAKSYALPVIPGVSNLQSSPMVVEDRLITVFHLDSWQRKNLIGMTKAIGMLMEKRPGLQLDVYGTGTPKTFMALRRALHKTAGHERVHLKGPVKHEQMQNLFKNYAALLLPSSRESYGMVYAEALFNGLPVLFSKNWGIDGYFDPAKIGYACDAHSAEDIARGIEHLLTHQAELKQSIAQMQTDGGFALIQKDAIIATYRQGIERALTSR